MQREEALPEGRGTAASVYDRGLNGLKLLRLKNEAEKLGPMTEGLAACFSRAMEVVQKRPVEPWTDVQLILQSNGRWLELSTGQIQQTILIWYDPHTGTVRVHCSGDRRWGFPPASPSPMAQ